MKKLCSIIFPSRGRLDLVEKLLFSIENNTYDKNNIEVIALCDQDDKPTIDLFTEISEKLSYDFFYLCRKRKELLHLPKDYYRYGIKLKSDSYFVWGIGNDTEFITPQWDKKLFEEINELDTECLANIENNTKYYYLLMKDQTAKSETLGSSFPILSSNYCDISRETVPSESGTWSGDHSLYYIVNKSPKFKILKIESIELTHTCWHHGTYEKDDVAFNMERNFLKHDLHSYPNQHAFFEHIWSTHPYLH